MTIVAAAKNLADLSVCRAFEEIINSKHLCDTFDERLGRAFSARMQQTVRQNLLRWREKSREPICRMFAFSLSCGR